VIVKLLMRQGVDYRAASLAAKVEAFENLSPFFMLRGSVEIRNE